jgi:hypothetical protein
MTKSLKFIAMDIALTMPVPVITAKCDNNAVGSNCIWLEKVF